MAPDADRDAIEWATVVGVVADHRFRSLVPDRNGPPEDPDIYFSMEQFDADEVVVVAATQAEPAAVIPTLRREIQGLDRQLAL